MDQHELEIFWQKKYSLLEDKLAEVQSIAEAHTMTVDNLYENIEKLQADVTGAYNRGYIDGLKKGRSESRDAR